MNKDKTLYSLAAVFLLVLGPAIPALAEHQCTQQIVNSDGEFDITTDCTAEYTQNSTTHTTPYEINTLKNNLLDNVSWGMQEQQERTVDSSMDEGQQRQQETAQTQQMQQEQQESELENYKRQHNM